MKRLAIWLSESQRHGLVPLEAVDEDAAIDGALPDVDALVQDGLVAVHDVQVVKARPHAREEARCRTRS